MPPRSPDFTYFSADYLRIARLEDSIAVEQDEVEKALALVRSIEQKIRARLESQEQAIADMKQISIFRNRRKYRQKIEDLQYSIDRLREDKRMVVGRYDRTCAKLKKLQEKLERAQATMMG